MHVLASLLALLRTWSFVTLNNYFLGVGILAHSGVAHLGIYVLPNLYLVLNSFLNVSS